MEFRNRLLLNESYFETEIEGRVPLKVYTSKIVRNGGAAKAASTSAQGVL